MPPQSSTDRTLRAEIAELRTRLEEAEEMLRAIRAGEVDALAVEGDAGPRLFTLQGLDAEQNRFRGEMLAQVSDAVVAVDSQERVTFLSAAAERQHGVQAADMLGRKLSEIFTRHWPSPEEEAAAWAAVREHGQWHGRYLQRTHQGRELHVDSSITALRDARGEIIGHLSAVRDITGRKRGEEEKREALLLLDTLLTRAPLGFAYLDRALRYVRINERLAEINGLSVAEHLGRTVEEVIPTLAAGVREVTERIVATGQPMLDHEFTCETPRAPGFIRHWNVSWYPVEASAERLPGSAQWGRK